MFYQNILTEVSPYFARVGHMSGFYEHRHADIEINYCIKGSFDVIINKKKHTVNEGELLLVRPMVAHSFPYNKDSNKKVLTLIVGVSFLKKFFSYLSKGKRDFFVIKNDKTCDTHGKLYSLLDETVEICETKNKNNELLIRGNLYKICSYLIDLTNESHDPQEIENKEMLKVANIEKALEMIYYDHSKPLTVDDAAEATGYGKSNFCKIFKMITGDTFHNVLNSQRVESACGLLSETNMSISEIAATVGFGETKSFCRIFKSVTSMTPGEYRKAQK